MSEHPSPRDASPGAAFDPSALRAAWTDLLSRSPHLHGPEAAARLGVPEADLLASRIGDGVEELAPDLPALLDGCDGWGKLLVAVRNGLGVALSIIDGCRASAGADGVVLVADGVAVRADASAASVAVAYLFEDHDAHGHTVSVNWFDARGDVVGRVFLMSKSGRERALPRLRRLASPGASAAQRRARSQDAPRPPMQRGQAVLQASRRVERVEPSAVGERAILDRSASSSWRVSIDGPGMALDYAGPLARSSHTPPAVHATDERIKLHLRMGAARALDAGRLDDGCAALRWSDEDGAGLVLAAVDDSARSDAWVDAMIGRRSA
jgi:hypothetical protein